MPTFDTNENRFVHVIEFAVDLLSNLTDADEVTAGSREVIAIFGDLMQTYGAKGVESMFTHVRDAEKFAGERASWGEQLKWNGRRLRGVEMKVGGTTLSFDKDIERTVDRAYLYLLHCKERAEEERQSISAEAYGPRFNHGPSPLQAPRCC